MTNANETRAMNVRMSSGTMPVETRRDARGWTVRIAMPGFEFSESRWDSERKAVNAVIATQEVDAGIYC